MKTAPKTFLCTLTLGAYFLFAPTAFAAAAGERGHDDHTDHQGDEHDHSEYAYLYGNHSCPVCADADAVDPHFFADVKNKKARVFARIYTCSAGCAKEIEKNMAKYYMSVYRTDMKSGKEIPARDLKNQGCPACDDKVDGKTSIEYNGMILSLSGEDCVEPFLKEPELGMRKLLPEAKEFKFEGASDHEDHDHDSQEKHEGHDDKKEEHK